ncbi:MAG TPA: hypothetical protein VII29_17225 [Terriglobales bacterium]
MGTKKKILGFTILNMLISSRGTSLAVVIFLLALGLAAQESQTVATILPNAPSYSQVQEQSTSRQSDSKSQEPGPDPKLPDSSVPQQNSAQTPVAKEQPKRILYIIPNYRAVSADAVVAPLNARGKFNLMVDDSFDYSTFISVGLLAGIAQAQHSVPQFDDGALAYSQYYWHIFVDQAVGNAFTEYLLPVAFKQDPRYFTKGHGGFFNRTGYALSRLVVTRTDSGGSQVNASEIIGNGAAASIAALYYPSQDRTWTKIGQRWGQQLALDATFNVIKEFWPDIRHNVLHKD